MPHPLLHLCLPAMDVTNRLVLDHVAAALRDARPDLANDVVQIVLGEVLNNILEHGYRDRPLGAVVVRVICADRVVSLDTWDWGRAYPHQVLPEGSAPDPEERAEGGYGWFLIRSLSRRISYRRSRFCNHLSLSIPV